MLIKTLSINFVSIFLLLGTPVAAEDPTVEDSITEAPRALESLNRLEQSLPSDNEGNYIIFRLPEPLPVLLTDPEGNEVRVACYEFEKFIEVLHMDNDLRDYSLKIVELSDEIEVLRLSNEEFRLVIEESDKQIEVLSDDRERLSKQWAAANLRAHIAENKPAFGSAFHWALTGVLGGGLAVAVILLVMGGG